MSRRSDERSHTVERIAATIAATPAAKTAMRIDVHVHHHLEFATPVILGFLNQLEQKLMTNQAELAASLQALADQAEKSRAEITGAVGNLTARVAELEQAVANAQNVDPAVEAAFANVKAAVQTLDDLNPDSTPA